MNNNLVYLGKLGKAIGLKGELKIYLETDFAEQFKKNSIIFLQNNNELCIENISIPKQTVKFIGIDTPEDATKLTNKEIFSTYEDTRKNCKLEKNQYFWFDLIGLEIVENNQTLGAVKDIARFTNTDYLEITTSQQLLDSGFAKSFLIPYLPNFVCDVNIEKKIVNTKGAFDILENS